VDTHPDALPSPRERLVPVVQLEEGGWLEEAGGRDEGWSYAHCRKKLDEFPEPSSAC
jgi:hypothetical protein